MSNCVPLYDCTTFCLSIHPSMGIRIASSLGLLWITLLWTFTYVSLYEHILWFLLARFLEMESPVVLIHFYSGIEPHGVTYSTSNLFKQSSIDGHLCCFSFPFCYRKNSATINSPCVCNLFHLPVYLFDRSRKQHGLEIESWETNNRC